MNPRHKLPLSPRNNFGSLNNEKLKHKKINIGINIVIKKSLMLLLGAKKNKINITDNVAKLRVPSIPSK